VLFTLDGEGEPVQRMELNLSTKVIQTLWSIVIIHKKNVYYKDYNLSFLKMEKLLVYIYFL